MHPICAKVSAPIDFGAPEVNSNPGILISNTKLDNAFQPKVF